jgi:RNA polymerase sigma-B factor
MSARTLTAAPGLAEKRFGKLADRARPVAAAPGAPAHAREDEQSLIPLFERWRCGRDKSAREALVERYMPLARGLARRYVHTQEPLEDLVQVACMGLVKAIDRFDAARGNRFAAYAIPTILGELRRHFRDTSWAVHVPRSGQELALEVERAGEELLARTGRAPTVGEIAQYLERDQEEILDGLQVARARGALSLDAPRPGGGDEDIEPRGETIGVEDDGYALIEDSSAVAQALAALTPRERRIVSLRFQHEMTQSEIAREVGLSQMQISRILRSALEQMRGVVESAAVAGCE